MSRFPYGIGQYFAGKQLNTSLFILWLKEFQNARENRHWRKGKLRYSRQVWFLWSFKVAAFFSMNAHKTFSSSSKLLSLSLRNYMFIFGAISGRSRYFHKGSIDCHDRGPACSYIDDSLKNHFFSTKRGGVMPPLPKSASGIILEHRLGGWELEIIKCLVRVMCLLILICSFSFIYIES